MLRIAFRSSILALVAACAGSAQQTRLPPHTAEKNPEAAPGQQFPPLVTRKPITQQLRSVPRIGVIDGRVVEIRADRIAIDGRSLAGDSAVMALFVGPITQITIDGHDGRLSDIRPGMDVRASYTEERSTVIADRIEARTPERR